MGQTWGSYARQQYPQLVEQGESRHQQRVLEVRREQREWTLERLIGAVKQFAQQNGRLPGYHEYRAENGLPSYTIFCKLSEQLMTDCLERRFGGYAGQNHKQGLPEQDDSNQEMELT